MNLSADTLQSINPATRELLGEVSLTPVSEVATQAARAKSAQEMWGEMSLKTRARILTDIRKQLVKKGNAIARLIADETGKTEWEGWIEILQTAEHFRTVCRTGPQVLRRERRSPGLLRYKRASVQYLPWGVAGIISPWNYPLTLTAGPLCEALMAGNGVIIKPSELTPLVGREIETLFLESGLPEGLVQFVYGFGDVGAALVESPDTDILCFTGSVAVGRAIAERCGQLLKPVILELGGNDPFIVLEDAPLNRAARAAAWGGFTNAGQTCISVERVIVVESVVDEFLAHLQAETEKLRVGPDKKKADMGAIINERQKQSILKQIREADARITCGGDDLEGELNGWFIRPCVVEVDSPDQTLTQKETFGPVITVQRVADEEEAIRVANATEYGLNASIFTGNRERALRLSRALRTGNVCINDVLSNYFCTHLPFGGVGISGIGRVHGPEGLKSFSRIQAVCEDRLGLKKELWWYPVSRTVQSLFKFTFRAFYG
ncbi:MAG: aldehyde dehydrogenase family protein [Candidatus Neomarinimicrobiota bacterium]|nr:MAG: aldehyde dehydrogenase family protein [Candidatus Neomarinimicrobiota bacterium]